SPPPQAGEGACRHRVLCMRAGGRSCWRGQIDENAERHLARGMIPFRNALAVLLQRLQVADQGLFGILDGLLVGGAPAMATLQGREKGEVPGLLGMELYGEGVGERLWHNAIIADGRSSVSADGTATFRGCANMFPKTFAAGTRFPPPMPCVSTRICQG